MPSNFIQDPSTGKFAGSRPSDTALTGPTATPVFSLPGVSDRLPADTWDVDKRQRDAITRAEEYLREHDGGVTFWAASSAVAAADAAGDKEALSGFALMDDPDARGCAAMMRSTPGHVVLNLLGDEDSMVRSAAAANPQIFALEEEWGVCVDRDAVLKDKDADVRRAFASNPKIDADTLDRLAQDRDEWVRSQACAHAAYRGDRGAWKWSMGRKLRALLLRR